MESSYKGESGLLLLIIPCNHLAAIGHGDKNTVPGPIPEKDVDPVSEILVEEKCFFCLFSFRFRNKRLTSPDDLVSLKLVPRNILLALTI